MCKFVWYSSLLILLYFLFAFMGVFIMFIVCFIVCFTHLLATADKQL
jgi:hypothetical protein